MLAGRVAVREAGAPAEVDADDEPPSGVVEVERVDVPGLGQAQCCGEDLVVHGVLHRRRVERRTMPSRRTRRPAPVRQAQARGCRRLGTVRTVFFLIAGRLGFAELNPHAA